MKHLARAFAVLGFLFQYGVPLALLSTVIALTHGETGAGLTSAGFFVLGVLVVIILGKLKNRILLFKNNIVKEALLSISPVVFWAVSYYLIGILANSVVAIGDYWKNILPFVLIGRMLYVVSGIFKNEQIEMEEEEKEKALIERVKGEVLNG